MNAIETEVHKLIECGFIHKEQHPDRIANIVHVLKKNRRSEFALTSVISTQPVLRTNFYFPITDVMINNMCGFERMSFMDDFFGYNQIKMHPDDEKHTSFRTPIGDIVTQ